MIVTFADFFKNYFTETQMGLSAILHTSVETDTICLEYGVISNYLI